MRFLIINGPNLNLLGTREQSTYGSLSFEKYLEELRSFFPKHTISYYQSNAEGALIDAIHRGEQVDGIILNGGAYTHSSIAMADAIRAIETPVVEVHISNVFAREAFRHHSYFSAVCQGTITGCGLDGYRLGILRLIYMLR